PRSARSARTWTNGASAAGRRQLEGPGPCPWSPRTRPAPRPGPVPPGVPVNRPRAERFSPSPDRGPGSALSLPAECDFGGLLDVALESGGACPAFRRRDAHLVIVVDDNGLAVAVWAGVGEGLEPEDSAVVAPRGAAG